MEIRNLQESDLEEVIHFVKNCDELTSERPSIFWLFWKFFRNTCFVAIDKKEILGILLGLQDQVKGDTGFIHEIGVSKTHRRQGIASTLIEKFETQIKTMGGKEISLTTFHTNQAAIDFYEKMGLKNNGKIQKVDQQRIEFIKKLTTSH